MSVMEYLPFILALVGAGVLAGITAGLFGIGGGVVIVPVLYFTLSSFGYTDTAMHVAVGTSLATIVATSVRSVLSHHEKQAVDWKIIKAWVPFIILGSFAGSFIAAGISSHHLTVLFAIIACFVAAQMVFGRPEWRLASEVPTRIGAILIGLSIGVLSALMGIGGGVFGVTVLVMCGRPIHQAIGTSAGFGAAIGLPAAIGYAINGWGTDGLPPMSLGFLSVPGLILIASITTLVAPIGVRLAHSLDSNLLRKIFGGLLVFTALNMLRKALLS